MRSHDLNKAAILILLAHLTIVAIPAPAADPSNPSTPPAPTFTAPPPTFNPTRALWSTTVKSNCQKAENTLDILLPVKFDADKLHRVLYILPVEAGPPKRWGDGLMEVKRRDLHNTHNLICVTMTFDTIPWYMEHATDPAIRQETYLRLVVEWVERTYKTPAAPDGRLLLGFSKSGWGAVSMLLRHPDFYGAAAAWDAPLMLRNEDWRSFEIPKACGTQERFAEYRLVDQVAKMPAEFKNQKRLVILGEKGFGTNPDKKYAPAGHTQDFHELLIRNAIPHEYRDDLKVDHHWETGWVKPAVDLLVALPGKDQRKD